MRFRRRRRSRNLGMLEQFLIRASSRNYPFCFVYGAGTVECRLDAGELPKSRVLMLETRRGVELAAPITCEPPGGD